MNVTIVGGAGLIGSSVVKQCLERGWKVTVIDNLSKGEAAIEPYMDKIKFMQKDISDIEVGDIINSHYLANLAALTMAECSENATRCMYVNTAAAVALGVLCDQLDIKHVFASSCSSYGTSEGLADENSELHPISSYAQSKAYAERNLFGVIVRFATAFGISPRNRTDLILNDFCLQAKRGKISIYGPNLWRPIAHYSDLALGAILALQLGQSGQTYNIGGFNITKLELAKLVQKHIPCEIEITGDTRDPRNYRVSFQKAEQELGLRMKITPEDSIKEFERLELASTAV